MAEDQDESQKTEEPTQKRLADALEKGDIVKSQEIVNWVMIAAGTLVLVGFGGSMSQALAETLRAFLATPEAMALDGGSAVHLAWSLVTKLAAIMVIPLVLLMGAALAGNMAQNPPRITPSKLAIKLDKLSPLAGFKRIFGRAAVANFVKGIAKITLVGVAAFVVLWPERQRLGGFVGMDSAAVLPVTLGLAVKVLGTALAILALVAVFDYVMAKRDFMRRHRMTKQEVRDEFRQTEGDPIVKAKIKQLRTERARKRMMAQVPAATVVITNPTHYAVALKYEQGQMAAPLCVAKGQDAIARRIREVAEENKVPVVENPPLARALYATVDIDQEVPPEHYKAVAGVIGYVLRLKASRALPRRI